ncbi:predicted protein [Aspergillus terreus NIH2624]|uniref:Antifungal protein n=1 Tax=Aspergillus terreus (strain NIH 2624 / FGSC A1156) TaxID=341663 RepID=Q0CFV0_ASPTN|nr:uncharacterized protein ATEG_07434 [Aspergillus terreus NIH2624]EAU31696.1 predicted protein [Aspergillus terreus NIH2624]
MLVYAVREYTAILALLALVPAALAEPVEPGPALESLEARAAAAAPMDGSFESLFEKRACKATKCICNKRQGQFCGNTKINKYCLDDHVYECNQDTGKACDYGYRTSCDKCGKLSC